MVLKNRTMQDKVTVHAVCGHMERVGVPPHKMGGGAGPKGLERIAKARARPCFRCQERMVKQDRCKTASDGKHAMFAEGARNRVCAL